MSKKKELKKELKKAKKSLKKNQEYLEFIDNGIERLADKLDHLAHNGEFLGNIKDINPIIESATTNLQPLVGQTLDDECEALEIYIKNRIRKKLKKHIKKIRRDLQKELNLHIRNLYDYVSKNVNPIDPQFPPHGVIVSSIIPVTPIDSEDKNENSSSDSCNNSHEGPETVKEESQKECTCKCDKKLETSNNTEVSKKEAESKKDDNKVIAANHTTNDTEKVVKPTEAANEVTEAEKDSNNKTIAKKSSSSTSKKTPKKETDKNVSV